MKSFMKTLVVTVGALAAVAAVAPTAQAARAPAAGTEGGFFGLDKLKDHIETSVPVINSVSEGMGGPAYEGSDAMAAISGVTPRANTVVNAVVPVAS